MGKDYCISERSFPSKFDYIFISVLSQRTHKVHELHIGQG